MKRSTLVIAAIVVALLGYWSYQRQQIGLDDIYVDRLVYLKRDSALFTGTLKVDTPPHWEKYSFRNGVPYGIWEYKYKGDLIHQGEYRDTSMIPKEIRQMLGQDVVVVNYWHEGELQLNEHPELLSIEVLKPKSFFQSNKMMQRVYFDSLANTVARTITEVKYRILFLSYHDNVFGERRCYELKYVMSGGRPVFQSIDSNRRW